MELGLGGIFSDILNANPPRQLSTSEPFGPVAQEPVQGKALPLPSEAVTYQYEQFARHNPIDVHSLPAQQSPFHLGPIVGKLGEQSAQVGAGLRAGDLNSDAAKRGIIIVGGHGQSNPELDRAIIIIGGKLRG